LRRALPDVQPERKRRPREGPHLLADLHLLRRRRAPDRRGLSGHCGRRPGRLRLREAVSAGAETTERALIARADELRPRLLEAQAATEERSFYSEELHEAFTDAGFYRLHVPKHYGGLEQSITAFYRVVMSVSRGCPSTGWMLSLGAGHAQQIAAFF